MEKIYNVQIEEKQIDELIEVLQLEPVRGKYHTTWGNKTLLGLRETIKAIILKNDN